MDENMFTLASITPDTHLIISLTLKVDRRLTTVPVLAHPWIFL